ncbi:MAG: response regulator [Eudoraea sp.]|nr:response regulator [Eudoraea sp.]
MKKITNILMIDDNKIDCFINEKVIRQLDTSIMCNIYYCPLEALNFIKSIPSIPKEDPEEFRPDLILLDINMPLMDGFQFLDALEELEFLKTDPICLYMLSSSSSEWDINRALDYDHCNGYINKPLAEYKICHVINSYNQNLKEHGTPFSPGPKNVLL